MSLTLYFQLCQTLYLALKNLLSKLSPEYGGEKRKEHGVNCQVTILMWD